MGRWTHYVKSLHGDNKLMKELLCDYPDRYTHFQFSILQLLPKAVTPDEVIQTETLWKKKLLTYEPLGMNANGMFEFSCHTSVFDPLLTQNRIGAGRSGRKQWKIRRTNDGKKHKSEPK